MEPTQSEVKENIRKPSILEIIGTVIGASSLLGALGWFFGRNYFRGFYGAIGVSTKLIDISNNEFIYEGQLALLTFMISSVFSLAALSFISDVLARAHAINVEGIANRYLHRVNVRLKKFLLHVIPLVIPFILLSSVSLSSYNVYEYTILLVVTIYLMVGFSLAVGIQTSGNTVPLQQSTKNALTFVRVMLLIILVLVMVAYAAAQTYNRGYQQGCRWVFSKSAGITIYSKNPILLENGKQNPAQEGIFQYTGYFGFPAKEYLILYKKVDDKNRRPETIYFVPKGEIISFDITQIPPSSSGLKQINDFCKTGD